MKKDFSYASLEKNGDGFKIIVSSYQDEQRKRFAIAQELGHLFLHMGYKTNAEIWEKQADKVPFQEKDPEKVRQANEFAAALLMPRYIFSLLWKQRRTLQNLEKELFICRQWRTSSMCR